MKRTLMVSAFLDEDLKARLEVAAQEMDRSLSWVAKQGIRKMVEEHEKEKADISSDQLTPA